MKKQIAVLDTSFWVLGHRADVLAYLFRFFAVVVPSAVENEIQARDPRYPQRVYGYQELFGLMKQTGSIGHPRSRSAVGPVPRRRSRRFGIGPRRESVAAGE